MKTPRALIKAYSTVSSLFTSMLALHCWLTFLQHFITSTFFSICQSVRLCLCGQKHTVRLHMNFYRFPRKISARFAVTSVEYMVKITKRNICDLHTLRDPFQTCLKTYKNNLLSIIIPLIWGFPHCSLLFDILKKSKAWKIFLPCIVFLIHSSFSSIYSSPHLHRITVLGGRTDVLVRKVRENGEVEVRKKNTHVSVAQNYASVEILSPETNTTLSKPWVHEKGLWEHISLF